MRRYFPSTTARRHREKYMGEREQEVVMYGAATRIFWPSRIGDCAARHDSGAGQRRRFGHKRSPIELVTVLLVDVPG